VPPVCSEGNADAFSPGKFAASLLSAGCKCTDVKEESYFESLKDNTLLLISSRASNVLTWQTSSSTVPSNSRSDKILLQELAELDVALKALSALWSFTGYLTDGSRVADVPVIGNRPPFVVELGILNLNLQFNQSVCSNMSLFDSGARNQLRKLKFKDSVEAEWNEYPYKDDGLGGDVSDMAHDDYLKTDQDGCGATSKSTRGEYLSLFEIIDLTKTKMGSRLLRKWLRRPLCQSSIIQERQKMVNYFVGNPVLRSCLRDDAQYLRGCPDLESLGENCTILTLTMVNCAAYSSEV
jgi:hypothetical protein